MKRLLEVLFIAILLFSLISCSAVSNLKSATDTGNAFMQALKDGDNTTSWSMLAQNVKDEIGGEAAWADFTSPRAFSEWNFNSTNIKNNVAQVAGDATLGSDTYAVTLVMDANGDGWLISGIDIKLK